jgi:hypothetical protein
MKMIRALGNVMNLESRGRRTPMRIRLRLLLVVCAMVTSIPHGNTFTCFSSADAVRQENAAAWPSWTLRAAGHEGAKCWYPSTRATARDHQNVSMPRTDPPSGNERFERDVETTGSATREVQFPNPVLQSSFDERFSAVCTAESSKAGYTVREPWCRSDPRN